MTMMCCAPRDQMHAQAALLFRRFHTTHLVLAAAYEVGCMTVFFCEFVFFVAFFIKKVELHFAQNITVCNVLVVDFACKGVLALLLRNECK